MNPKNPISDLSAFCHCQMGEGDHFLFADRTTRDVGQTLQLGRTCRTPPLEFALRTCTIRDEHSIIPKEIDSLLIADATKEQRRGRLQKKQMQYHAAPMRDILEHK
jgi:hypothetical protein